LPRAQGVADAQVNVDQQRKIGADPTEEVLRAPFDGVVTGLMAVPATRCSQCHDRDDCEPFDLIVQLNLEPESGR